MRLNHPSIQLIEQAATALGELNDRLVYVGGATVPLYIKDELSQEPRPTFDVDCVIEMVAYSEFATLEDELRKKGFSHDMRKNAPICRWVINGVTVDIMPTDTNVLGFSNSWYVDGMRKTQTVKLPSGNIIKIFELPYFIAAKIEAYLSRGANDYRLSQDIEDIITVFDGIDILSMISGADSKIRSYFRENFSRFIKDDLFIEAITAHLDPGPLNTAKAKKILDALKATFDGN